MQGIKRLKAFYGPEEVPMSYLACPIDMAFDLEPGVTAIPGWEYWPLKL